MELRSAWLQVTDVAALAGSKSLRRAELPLLPSAFDHGRDVALQQETLGHQAARRGCDAIEKNLPGGIALFDRRARVVLRQALLPGSGERKPGADEGD